MTKDLIQRLYSTPPLTKKICCIVSGPRQIGKTTYLKTVIQSELYFDLGDFDTFRKLSFQINFLSQILPEEINRVSIDNIHLLPSLLSEIDQILQARSLQFFVTTPSLDLLLKFIPDDLQPLIETRSLKPFTSADLAKNKNFDLASTLRHGSLPFLINKEPKDFLLTEYAGALLLREFNATGKIKKIENFSRFMNTVGVLNGREVTYEEVSSLCGVPARTVREYFKLLESYELGQLIESAKLTKSSSAKNKFYFFDVGVAHAFKNDFNIRENFENYEQSLKHFIFLELSAYKNLIYPGLSLNFWSDYRGHSLDLVLSSQVAVVIKSTKTIHQHHLKHIAKMMDISGLKKCFFVTLDTTQTLIKNSSSEKIQHFAVDDFLEALWKKRLFLL